MEIQNRDRFLNNIAKNLGRPRRTGGVKRPKWTVQPQWDIHKDLSQDELVTVLEKQCATIHTDFKRTDQSNLQDILHKIIAGYGGKSIIAPTDKRNDDYGLTSFYEQLQQEGLDFHLWKKEKGEENILIAEQADIGITFSDLTLAESATVTLFNDKYNGRTLSLLPKSYIAIIPKQTLVPRLTQATKYIHDEHREGQSVSSCVSFISGPSNSADIEMNLIVGVHGPIQATYILVDD